MERNVLFSVGNGYNESAVYLRDNFGFSIRPLHVRDVEKKEFLQEKCHRTSMLEPNWCRKTKGGIVTKSMKLPIKKQLEEKGVHDELEVKFSNFLK